MLGQAPAALEVYPYADVRDPARRHAAAARARRAGLRVRVAALRAAGLVWDEYFDHDSLDALAAALTAWRFVQGLATPLGDDRDGYIWAAGAGGELLASYGRLTEREAPRGRAARRGGRRRLGRRRGGPAAAARRGRRSHHDLVERELHDALARRPP